MFSYQSTILANIVLALCASAHPAQPSDHTFNGKAPLNHMAPPHQPSACSNGDYIFVTSTYTPEVTYTATVMTTIVQKPSGQPTQLLARRGSSSSESTSVPITTTVTSTATHTVTDSTLLTSTLAATATSTVSVTSTITASTATETDTMTVTSTGTTTQSTTTA